MVFVAPICSLSSEMKHRSSIVTEENMELYGTVNSLSVFVKRKYTEFANQSQLGDDLEQIHIFFLISKKPHPGEQTALEQ